MHETITHTRIPTCACVCVRSVCVCVCMCAYVCAYVCVCVHVRFNVQLASMYLPHEVVLPDGCHGSLGLGTPLQTSELLTGLDEGEKRGGQRREGGREGRGAEKGGGQRREGGREERGGGGGSEGRGKKLNLQLV